MKQSYNSYLEILWLWLKAMRGSAWTGCLTCLIATDRFLLFSLPGRILLGWEVSMAILLSVGEERTFTSTGNSFVQQYVL